MHEIDVSFEGSVLEKDGHEIILSERRKATVFCYRCGYSDTMNADFYPHQRIAYQLYQVGDIGECPSPEEMVFDGIIFDHVGKQATEATMESIRQSISDQIPDGVELDGVAYNP